MKLNGLETFLCWPAAQQQLELLNFDIDTAMNAQYSERRRPMLILSLSLHFNNIFLSCNCEIVRKIFIKCVGMWCICHNIDVKIDQKLGDVSDAVIL